MNIHRHHVNRSSQDLKIHRPHGMLVWLTFGIAQACAAQSLDLMQAWDRARQADPQMVATQSTRSTAQALRQQADAVWKPAIVASATGGAMSQQTQMTGAEFSMPGQPSNPGATFNTSVNHDTLGR